jgi:hypothetical protein
MVFCISRRSFGGKTERCETQEEAAAAEEEEEEAARAAASVDAMGG